jgi:hypothetical protein
MPTIPDGNGTHGPRQVEGSLEQLRTVLDQPLSAEGVASSDIQGDPFGGSGNLEPPENLDPPDTDRSFPKIDDGLDLLESIVILHDPGPGVDPPEDNSGGDNVDWQQGFFVSTEPGAPEIVIILLASLAISLLLLALLGGSSSLLILIKAS